MLIDITSTSTLEEFCIKKHPAIGKLTILQVARSEIHILLPLRKMPVSPQR